MSDVLTEAIRILHNENCSCVILTHGRTTICQKRGISDLYRLLQQEPEILKDSIIADKVIGKGAAALMIEGGASEVYGDVISHPAFDLLKASAIPVSFKVCVNNIINRTGTGICPVEELCKDAATASECLPLIENFISSIKKN